MGVDAMYHLRFASKEEAETALLAISTPVRDYAGIRESTNGAQAQMYLSIAEWDETLITASSWNRYLEPEVIRHANPMNPVGDLEYHRAVGVLADLVHLQSFPEMRGVTIHYLSDHHDPTTEEGEPVDDDLMTGLWNLASSPTQGK